MSPMMWTDEKVVTAIHCRALSPFFEDGRAFHRNRPSLMDGVDGVAEYFQYNRHIIILPSLKVMDPSTKLVTVVSFSQINGYCSEIGKVPSDPSNPHKKSLDQGARRRRSTPTTNEILHHVEKIVAIDPFVRRSLYNM